MLHELLSSQIRCIDARIIRFLYKKMRVVATFMLRACGCKLISYISLSLFLFSYTQYFNKMNK